MIVIQDCQSNIHVIDSGVQYVIGYSQNLKSIIFRLTSLRGSEVVLTRIAEEDSHALLHSLYLSLQDDIYDKRLVSVTISIPQLVAEIEDLREKMQPDSAA